MLDVALLRLRSRLPRALQLHRSRPPPAHLGWRRRSGFVSDWRGGVPAPTGRVAARRRVRPGDT